MRSAFWLRLLAIIAFLASAGASAAPPPTSIVVNGFGTTVMPPASGVYNITGGTTAGSNLFHSFSTFNLGTGDTADFNVTSGISNILARVTGGPSTIDGTITSTLPGGGLSSANLFFINPAGVLFTSNAQVNLGGSFIVSTANYVKLSDGSIFYGDINHPTEDAGLTAAPVSAFGFIAGSSPSALTINDGATFTIGGSLQFVGGDFTLGSNTLSVSGNSSVLGIFSGSQANATTDASVPYLNGGVTDYSTAAHFTSYGNVTLGDSTGSSSGASLSASGSGGAVVIRGGRLVQQGAGGTIFAKSKVAIQGDSLAVSGSISTNTGNIGIDTTGDVTLTGGEITSKGGSITLGQMSMVNLTLDSTSTIDSVGGPVTVIATGDIDLNGGSIESTNAGGGNAGSVNVTDAAGNITLTDGAEIASITNVSGNAGNVTINGGVSVENSTKTLSITGNGVATLNTGIFSISNGTGDAGAVSVTSIGNVNISSGGQIASVATSTNGGNAQSVTLTLNPNNLFDTSISSRSVASAPMRPPRYQSSIRAPPTPSSPTAMSRSTPCLPPSSCSPARRSRPQARTRWRVTFTFRQAP